MLSHDQSLSKRLHMIRDDRRTGPTIFKLPNGIVTADMELISASKSLMESVLQISGRGVAEVLYINETLAQGVYLATKKFLRRRGLRRMFHSSMCYRFRIRMNQIQN